MALLPGKKFLTVRQNEKRAGEYERTRERTIERVSAEVEKQGRKRKVTREEIKKLESGEGKGIVQNSS